jgi:23S rRNA (guanosine2251-2'-O)-methyltransferase
MSRFMKAEAAVIFGINAILEKLKASPHEIVEILVCGDRAAMVEMEAQKLAVRVSHADRTLLDRIVGGAQHQGAVARVAAFRYGSFSELVSGSDSPSHILILDEITDPRNLGALLRCAEGAGVRHVVIPKDRAVGITPTVVKSSAGAAHHVIVYRVTNLRQAMKQLKASGFWLVGLDAGAAASIYNRIYPDKLAIVLGSEGRGMRPLVRQECDFLVAIPMFGKVQSLNVAVAGAVFLYEVRRQLEHVDNNPGRG